MLSELQKTSDRAGGKHGPGCCSCNNSHAFYHPWCFRIHAPCHHAAGIKDAMESAVVSVVNDNYNEVYHGVREGYAAGYEPDDTGFAASVDHGDIYGRMCFLLGLEEDGNSYVRYNNSGELEYRLKNLSVDIHNTALASPGGTYYADAEVTMEVPVRFAGKILSNMSVRLKVRAAYREKF